jgi:hypothetical protein
MAELLDVLEGVYARELTLAGIDQLELGVVVAGAKLRHRSLQASAH